MQTFSAGMSGSGLNASPALAFFGGTLVCEYCQIPTYPSAAFVYREDAGGGFGSPTSFGSFDGAVTRMQAMAFSTPYEATFGTPTTAFASFESPD
jgi:hypothetical protein